MRYSLHQAGLSLVCDESSLDSPFDPSLGISPSSEFERTGSSIVDSSSKDSSRQRKADTSHPKKNVIGSCHYDEGLLQTWEVTGVCVVTHLKSSSAYVFFVVSHNSDDWAVNKNNVTIGHPLFVNTVQNTPMNPSLVNVSSRSIQFTWTYDQRVGDSVLLEEEGVTFFFWLFWQLHLRISCVDTENCVSWHHFCLSWVLRSSIG